MRLHLDKQMREVFPYGARSLSLRLGGFEEEFRLIA